MIEESITSQLIDQRVLQRGGAPSTDVDSSVSAKNQQKWIYEEKKPQILCETAYTCTQTHTDTRQHLVPECKRPPSIKHREDIIQGKQDLHKSSGSKEDVQDHVKLSVQCNVVLVNVLDIISYFHLTQSFPLTGFMNFKTLNCPYMSLFINCLKYTSWLHRVCNKGLLFYHCISYIPWLYPDQHFPSWLCVTSFYWKFDFSTFLIDRCLIIFKYTK